MRKAGHLLVVFCVLTLVPGCDNTGPRRNPPGSNGGSPAVGDRNRLDAIAHDYEQGRLDQALADLKRYLRTYQKDDLAWTILGHWYREREMYDEADEAYEKAVDINPNQIAALTGQGMMYRIRKDYAAAMAAYEQAVKIDPKYAQAYSSMATIDIKRGNDKQALEHAKKGYELDSKDPVIASNLAIAYHYNGDTKNRDKMTAIAKRLGYKNIDILQEIYSGEMTVRD